MHFVGVTVSHSTCIVSADKVKYIQLRIIIFICNKKVLPHERKRHTARCVASTPYVVLTGYPPARVPPCQGTPPGQGTPLARVPPSQGTPPPGYPPWPGYPPGQGTPPRLDLAGYPPPTCPMAFWEMLQSITGYGYPPSPRCGQTNKVKLLPSRRTTYAGGNKEYIKTRRNKKKSQVVGGYVKYVRRS